MEAGVLREVGEGAVDHQEVRRKINLRYGQGGELGASLVPAQDVAFGSAHSHRGLVTPEHEVGTNAPGGDVIQ